MLVHLEEVRELVKLVHELGMAELLIEAGDFKVHIKNITPWQGAPVVPAVSSAGLAVSPARVAEQKPESVPVKEDKLVSPPHKEETPPQNIHIVRAPMVGTFYSRPAPEKPAFVQVGSKVKKGDVLCLIEAMKIFNEIESEVNGTVVEILVEDGTPVEYDQPIMKIDTSA